MLEDVGRFQTSQNPSNDQSEHDPLKGLDMTSQNFRTLRIHPDTGLVAHRLGAARHRGAAVLESLEFLPIAVDPYLQLGSYGESLANPYAGLACGCWKMECGRVTYYS